MEYYRIGGQGDDLIVRLDTTEYSAECFDALTSGWVRLDAWYDEIVYNGRGIEVTEADALAVIERELTAA
jgi:hypothetical protein